MLQRLELTWIGKDHEPRLEPRILLEKPELRCGQPDPSTSDWQGMLVHGDNLLALKALEQDYAGKVKCVCTLIHLIIQVRLLSIMTMALNIPSG